MPTTPYCTYDDLVMRFGTANVHKWSDMDNDQNPTKIKTRVDWACIQAADDLNDDLRGCRYDVPFISPFPPSVVDNAVIRAACILYDLRGITDVGADGKKPVNRMSGFAQQYATWVQKIWACTITLSVPSISRSYPTPVIDNGTDCYVQQSVKEPCPCDQTVQHGVNVNDPFIVTGGYTGCG